MQLMNETELKAYFFPEEKEIVENIQSEIEKKINKQFFTEQIVDIFLDKSRELKKRNCELRLRKQGEKYYLTYKGKVDTSQGYKIREELETQISDGIVLESMFKRMGYKKIREVKKERKFLNYNNCLITIDIFKKIGFVIEIEGTQHDIEKTISFFSLNRQRFKAQTYTDVLKLYHISKEKKIKTIKNEKP